MLIIGIKELKPTGKQKLVTDPFFRWKPQTSLFLQTQLFTNFIRVSSGTEQSCLSFSYFCVFLLLSALIARADCSSGELGMFYF